MLQKPKGIFHKMEWNELWRLIEETEHTAVKKPSDYKLLNGLEHRDICVPVPEGSGSFQREDDLDLSMSEDVSTISNRRDCWR